MSGEVVLTVRVTRRVAEKLSAMAKANRRSRASEVLFILDKVVEKHEDKVKGDEHDPFAGPDA